MKIICQNCFEVLGERNPEEDYFKYEPAKVDSIIQGVDSDHAILTLACPKCHCMLQVKV